MLNNKHKFTRLALCVALVALSACSTPQKPVNMVMAPAAAPLTATFAAKSPSFGAHLAALENLSAQKNVGVKIVALENAVKLGRDLKFKIQSSSDAYVSLYIFQKSGKVHAMMENAKIQGGFSKIYPDDYGSFVLKAQPPTGATAVMLLGSSQPIRGTIKHNGQYWGRPTPIKATQIDAINAIASQVNFLQPEQWDSDLLEINIY